MQIFNKLFFLIFIFKINTKNETNRDLKFALTSSTDDTQTIYQQMHQLQKNNIDLQKRYDQDIAERNAQIEILRTEQKKLAVHKSIED